MTLANLFSLSSLLRVFLQQKYVSTCADFFDPFNKNRQRGTILAKIIVHSAIELLKGIICSILDGIDTILKAVDVPAVHPGAIELVKSRYS